MRGLRLSCLRLVFAIAALTVAGIAMAQAIEPLPFKGRTEEVRFQKLTATLRCPMCQNETLADSNAPIARDLRHQIFDLMQAGQSDAQIKAFLVDRYSNFVLYDPPLEGDTVLLWFGPAVVLILGAIAVVMHVRRRARAAAATAPTTSIDIDTEDDW
jgi:cytochrome c-type biogenesis protein CcmH